MKMSPGLKKIKDTRGLRVSLARSLGIKPEAITQWTRVPAERTLKVERITNIPRNELRPDLYPDD